MGTHCEGKEKLTFRSQSETKVKRERERIRQVEEKALFYGVSLLKVEAPFRRSPARRHQSAAADRQRGCLPRFALGRDPASIRFGLSYPHRVYSFALGLASPKLIREGRDASIGLILEERGEESENLLFYDFFAIFFQIGPAVWNRNRSKLFLFRILPLASSYPPQETCLLRLSPRLPPPRAPSRRRLPPSRPSPRAAPDLPSRGLPSRASLLPRVVLANIALPPGEQEPTRVFFFFFFFFFQSIL